MKQSAIKTLMVMDSMDHALDHHQKCIEARAKTLDRKARETFFKMNPKVNKPKDSVEVVAVENDDGCDNQSRLTLWLRARQILPRTFVFLRFQNLELNLDHQTLGPHMRRHSLSF